MHRAEAVASCAVTVVVGLAVVSRTGSPIVLAPQLGYWLATGYNIPVGASRAISYCIIYGNLAHLSVF